MSFEGKLAALPQASIEITDDGDAAFFGDAPICLQFADGTALHPGFWRLIKRGRVALTSFEHGQQYGTGAPVDARAMLRAELDGHPCTGVQVDGVTGDLVLRFADNLGLQVLKLTQGEDWEIYFADGGWLTSNLLFASDQREPQ